MRNILYFCSTKHEQNIKTMEVVRNLSTGSYRKAIRIDDYKGTYHSGVHISMLNRDNYNDPIATFWLSVDNDNPNKDAVINDLTTIRNAIDEFIKLCQN